jgi:hypothetical protein
MEGVAIRAADRAFERQDVESRRPVETTRRSPRSSALPESRECHQYVGLERGGGADQIVERSGEHVMLRPAAATSKMSQGLG